MDVDAAGGAITGGLIAGAIEKPTGEAGEHHGACADCGAEVTGRFCSNCGQAAHVHRSLLHLGEELLHGVMHFDGRIWRTLPLLAFNPGRLTREWVQGKRTRYVSPLAIFLFTLFVMFFALSFMPAAEIAPVEHVDPQVEMTVLQGSLTTTQATLAELEAAPEGQRSDVAITTTRQAIGRIESRIAETEEKIRRINAGEAAIAPRSDSLAPGSWQAQVADMAKDVSAENTGHGVTATVLKKLKNPDLALYKLQQTLYKFSFLLVPLSIPFVALLFLWRRGSTLYDHGVFVLYSLTFMSMLAMVVMIMATLFKGTGMAAASVAALIAPVHMFAQLKGAYNLSIFSTLWRFVALLIFCTWAASFFIIAIIYLGLGH